MARKPYNPSTVKPAADGPMFVTWDDKPGSKQAAFSRAYSSVAREPVVMRSQASSLYQNISPGNVSIRDGYDRSDYDLVRPGEALPTLPKDIIRECMNCYRDVGIIRNIIDLMADFGCQGVELNHPNERIETFYKEWFRKVNGKERSERFLNYLYRTGNVVVKRLTAKLPVTTEEQMRRATAKPDLKIDDKSDVSPREIPWKYRFMNPMCVMVMSEEISTFIDSDSFIFAIQVPATLSRKVNSPKPGDMEMIQNIPNEILTQIRAGTKMIILDPAKTRAFYYKRDDWMTWAEPMVNAILADLNLYKKMRLADLSALDGAISSIRVWKLGDIDAHILPTELAINRLATMLMNNVGGGVMDLVWGPEIQLVETSTEVHKFLGQSKYEPVLNAIYAGLGIPPTLTGSTTADGGGFTNNFISLKTLTERLQYGRDLLKSFWDEEIRIVQKAMGFRFPATVTFDRMVLTDEAAEKQLLLGLADRDLISTETLQERFGEDPAIEQVRIRREQRRRKAQQSPPKAGPFHNAEQQHELKKMVAASGTVTPSQLGIELDQKKEGEKSPLEMQNEFKAKRQNAKVVSKKTKGQPGQGRPKNKKDSKKRKNKTVPIRTSAKFIETFVWAENAQARISKIAGDAYLNKLNKKSMRELTTAESNSFETFKFFSLCQFKPGDEITEESIKRVVGTKLTVPSQVNALLSATVTKFIEANAKEPPIEVLRRFHAGTYALWQGDYESSKSVVKLDTNNDEEDTEDEESDEEEAENEE